MNEKKSKKGSARLSRERALAAAVTLADEVGIDALSMRKLATSLGVEAMSLYHHVANKDDILDGMVDSVFAEIPLPSLDVEWKRAMLDRSNSLRAAMLRHPWAVALMDSRASPGMATLRHHDAMIGCCRAAGFTIAGAAHALSLIDSYIYGFVLQEVALPFDAGDELDHMIDGMLPPEMVAALPHLAEFTIEHVLQPGYAYGDEFSFGINLVLDGLQALL